jgi:hypothetical protein
MIVAELALKIVQQINQSLKPDWRISETYENITRPKIPDVFTPDNQKRNPSQYDTTTRSTAQSGLSADRERLLYTVFSDQFCKTSLVSQAINRNPE